MTQQWTKAELEDWARGWTRTPMTVLHAFIDAGFCSDAEPLREETRLWPKSDTSTVSTTKAVMSEDVREVIAGLLAHSSPIGVFGDHFRDKARSLISPRPDEPNGQRVWYRGWECYFNETAAGWTGTGWVACLGGEDLDCISVDARTWEELLDEIDDYDMTEALA